MYVIACHSLSGGGVPHAREPARNARVPQWLKQREL